MVIMCLLLGALPLSSRVNEGSQLDQQFAGECAHRVESKAPGILR